MSTVRAKALADRWLDRPSDFVRFANRVITITSHPMNATMAPPVQTLPTVQARRERLLSLDALRGFDMFWIVGGEELLRALARAWPIAPMRELEHQLSHSNWENVTFYDLNAPLTSRLRVV